MNDRENVIEIEGQHYAPIAVYGPGDEFQKPTWSAVYRWLYPDPQGREKGGMYCLVGVDPVDGQVMWLGDIVCLHEPTRGVVLLLEEVANATENAIQVSGKFYRVRHFRGGSLAAMKGSSLGFFWTLNGLVERCLEEWQAQIGPVSGVWTIAFCEPIGS